MSDEEEMLPDISGPELASIMERLALTRTDGENRAVSGAECERVLYALGLTRDHASRRTVARKREDLLQVGEHYPDLI